MKNKLLIIGVVVTLAVVLVSGVGEGGANGSGPLVTTIAGDKMTCGSSDGASIEERSIFSANITTDGSNLFMADIYNHTIRKVVIPTAEVMILAGKAGVSGSTDGTKEALFNYPQGITTDGTNLYVADSINCTIRKVVISTGEVSTFAGTAGVCGSIDGIGIDARFGTPYGITTDGTNLYVVDAYNGTIRKINISTGVVTTLTSPAKTVLSTDGTGTTACFKFATAITTDGINLYVVDNAGRIIRQVVIATGEVTTLAGTTGVSGSADGTGPDAQFGAANGITTNGTNLYVADTYNGTVRQITISNGEVSTLAGTARSFGFIDGSAIAARFNLVAGITTDGTNLYVVNNGNNTIRKIVISTGEVTTLQGRAGVSTSTGGTGSTI